MSDLGHKTKLSEIGRWGWPSPPGRVHVGGMQCPTARPSEDIQAGHTRMLSWLRAALSALGSSCPPSSGLAVRFHYLLPGVEQPRLREGLDLHRPTWLHSHADWEELAGQLSTEYCGDPPAVPPQDTHEGCTLNVNCLTSRATGRAWSHRHPYGAEARYREPSGEVQGCSEQVG